MNIHQLFLLFLRILQCSGSLIVLILEILRHTNVIDMIELDVKGNENNFELVFEYCVMNLGFVTSVLYIFRFNSQRHNKQRRHKYDIVVDCVLMNAWMIFGILRLTPQFEDTDFLICNQYGPKKRKGCITYVSTLVIGYSISLSYFITAIAYTWKWSEETTTTTTTTINNNNNNNNNIIDNGSSNNSNFSLPKSLSSLNQIELNRTESNEIRNSQIVDDIHEVIIQGRGGVGGGGRGGGGDFKNYEPCTEISSKELKEFKYLFCEDSEFDSTIVVFSKPSPCFLKYEPSSRNSSLHENCSNPKYISEYSLGSSFSRTYGSIIIPRKYTSQNEFDTTNTCNSSNSSRYDGSIVIGRKGIISTYSENSSKRLSSAFSEKTSRSSKYDGSIIIKLVT